MPVAKKKSNKKRRTVYSAPALEKGLDILELFANEGEAMTTSAIAQKLGRSVGEVFRMIMVLEQRGYLVPVANDRYFLSLKMYTQGARHALVKRLTIAAVDTMKQLVREVEQSCHLVVYSQGRGVVVAQINSPGDRIHTVRLGAEAPLTNSCSGHLLLAYADPEARKEMIDLAPAHLRTRASKRKIDEIVERVLKRGFEIMDSQQVAGVQDIGFPIFDDSGAAVAALVMPYMQFLDGSEKTSVSAAETAVAKAADKISIALGFEK